MEECKSCHKTFQHLLIHLYRNKTKYNCKQDYTEEQLRKMKKESKNTTIANTNGKRQKTYDKSKRRERYLHEKSTTKQGKHNINPTITKNENLKTQSLQTDSLALDTPVQNVFEPDSLLKCKINEGFKRMELLINKEIKRMQQFPQKT